LMQGKLAAEVGFEFFAGLLRLPWREAAAGLLADRLQSAIGLCDVRGEREHHVNDEKLIGLVGTAQPFQERGADMTDDRVVMAGAKLAVEVTHARGVGLFGEAVERRTRNIEKERVERLVDDVAWIALQVVQVRCTSGDIRLLEALAALPKLA